MIFRNGADVVVAVAEYCLKKAEQAAAPGIQRSLKLRLSAAFILSFNDPHGRKRFCHVVAH